jgi:hypothetical protein
MHLKDDQLQKALDRNSLLQKLVEEEKSKRLALEQDLHSFRSYQDKCVNYEQRI